MGCKMRARVAGLALAACGSLLVGSALAAPPGLTTFSETFDGGSNVGGWTFGNLANETIEPAGGNPGPFLRNDFLDTFAPSARTTPGVASPFVGNYRERGVSVVEADLALFRVDFSAEGRPVTVILYSDAGTPDDPSDDCQVYRVGGKPGPRPDGRWNRYRFRVPSRSSTLPPGWQVRECGNRTGEEGWNLVIEDVDQLRFFVGDPELFYIFQVWDIGLDNPSIAWGSADPGDPAD